MSISSLSFINLKIFIPPEHKAPIKNKQDMEHSLRQRAKNKNNIFQTEKECTLQGLNHEALSLAISEAKSPLASSAVMVRVY